MAKGYWIARVDVSDPDQCMKYMAANGAVLEKYKGRFLVRAGAFEAVEGKARSRNVVIEFPSFQDARACYHLRGMPGVETLARFCRRGGYRHHRRP